MIETHKFLWFTFVTYFYLIFLLSYFVWNSFSFSLSKCGASVEWIFHTRKTHIKTLTHMQKEGKFSSSFAPFLNFSFLSSFFFFFFANILVELFLFIYRFFSSFFTSLLPIDIFLLRKMKLFFTFSTHFSFLHKCLIVVGF
jgi:hypothetical protein